MQNGRFIITVVGHDAVGIIAKITAYLAERGINILDISQTVMSGCFNMMMIVDAAEIRDVATTSKELSALGEEIGMVIRCQHEDIFNVMHRV